MKDTSVVRATIPPALPLYRYPISTEAGRLFSCRCGDRATWRIAEFRVTADGYYRCDEHAAEYPEDPDSRLAYRLANGQGVLRDGSLECHSDHRALMHFFDDGNATCRCGRVDATDPIREPRSSEPTSK